MGYRSYISYYDKPKKFKFVERSMVYSCVVHANNYGQSVDIELKFKLSDHNKSTLDKEWMDNYLYSIFGRKIVYYEQVFKRDNSAFAFLHDINITEEEYMKYIRTKKLSRLLENNIVTKMTEHEIIM